MPFYIVVNIIPARLVAEPERFTSEREAEAYAAQHSTAKAELVVVKIPA